MHSIFEHVVEVRDSDIDVLGHVNNVVYVQWMQNAAYAHSAALGWTLERYMELGAGWVARMHQIEYLQPAFSGQKVIIKTWIADMKKVTSTRRYRMLRMDPPLADALGVVDPMAPQRETLIAVAHTNWAFIDFKKGTPQRIPAMMAADFPLIIDSQQGGSL
jgi:acyl-CoA thioester hydrolase